MLSRMPDSVFSQDILVICYEDVSDGFGVVQSHSDSQPLARQIGFPLAQLMDPVDYLTVLAEFFANMTNTPVSVVVDCQNMKSNLLQFSSFNLAVNKILQCKSTYVCVNSTESVISLIVIL